MPDEPPVVPVVEDDGLSGPVADVVITDPLPGLVFDALAVPLVPGRKEEGSPVGGASVVPLGAGPFVLGEAVSEGGLEDVTVGTLRGNPFAAQSSAKSMLIQSDPCSGARSMYYCERTRVKHE